MSVPAAIAVLAAQWETTVPDLPAERLRAIAAAARTPGVDAGDPAAVRSAAHGVTDVLAAALPRAHPVRRALSGIRFAGARSTGWDGTSGRLTAIAAAAELAIADREAEAALLAAPTVSWREARGSGPGGEHLIRLGENRAPSFQFDRSGRPIPVVIEVNRLLDARTDPWGAADWWLGPNAWLDGVPAALLGEVDDRVLVLAAEAERGVD